MTSETSKVQFPKEAPEKASAMTKAIWPEAVRAFESMTKSAAAIDSIKGSAGEILSKAKATVLATPEGKYVQSMVDEYRRLADEGAAWIGQQANETASAAMKGADPKRKAAEATFAEAAKDFESALTFLKKDKACAKVLATVTLPSVKRAQRSTGSSSAKANTKGLAYFRQVKDGEKTYQSEAQNSASSLAWYYGACLNGNEKNGSMGSLVQYASSKGVDVKGATPWTLTLPNGTILGAEAIEAK